MENENHSNCGCSSTSGWIPVNSKIQVNADHSITIQAPSGWVYVGRTVQNPQLMRVASGTTSVSCTCNSSGSCMPFVGSGPLGSTSGCAGDCTNCTMKQSARVGNENHDFSSGGYIDSADTVRFIDNNLPFPAAFSEMFELPDVESALKAFIEKVYGGLPFPIMKEGENFIATPDGYTLASVSVFGRATLIPVPTIALPDNVLRMAVGGGASKGSCSCTQGTCTLKTHTVLGMGSTYCEGDCTGTCTLN